MPVNPDGIDLISAMYDAMEAADAALQEMHSLADDKIAKDRIYREAKSKQILRERVNNNTPVSIVQDIVKGLPHIANLKAEYECAEALYQANYESLLWNKKKVDVIKDLIAREYSGGFQE